MPEFPHHTDMTREQVLNMILSSIAMEELALSHILNAEGEKIQHVLGKGCGCCAGCAPCNSCKTMRNDEILAVNRSVTELLEMVMQNQLILKNKMDRVLEYLPKPLPPPAPPEPPCPPDLPCHTPWACCPMSPPCQTPPDPPPCDLPCDPARDRQETALCLTAINGLYGCNSALAWCADGGCGGPGIAGGDCSRIQLPRSGSFKVSVCLDLGLLEARKKSELLELLITCRDKPPVSHMFCQNSGQRSATFCGSVILRMPCSASPYFASLLVRVPEGICVKKGSITFRRLFQCA